MLVAITLLRVDFGPMKRHEMNAIAGDLFTTPGRPYEGNEEEVIKENSHVLDLILPVAVLIASCIISMIYTGGFLKVHHLWMHLQDRMRLLDLYLAVL